ncbi:KpsF/GutQ family sugar-phosphate isomerase [Kiritimatiella glycovorans]|uniref:KpsF/GutQ family sugar-phosphate isomerase n=1 Tax=Kiritimatiella glycovorans TaxID=1307763 RepID=UPI001F0297AC|nr:KpsF/GutQ family sugar-phosphate isomerase [Kiritimatiella glycovorans]
MQRACEIIDTEIEGLERLKARLDGSFREAVELILERVAAGGKVVITGVGKNTHIGRKIAATLTSVGTPAVPMHPIEAMHGDFGLLCEPDVVLAMSYSGASEELLNLIPAIRRNGNPIIGVTGFADSPLARHADLVLSVEVNREACPFNLAPTASTTAALALGDALAMVLLEARGFQREDYAKLHPGGAIGRSLLLRVSDVMRSGKRLARVHRDARVREALVAMTGARSGSLAVVDDDERVVGIFTDGDLRRHLVETPDLPEQPLAELMTPDPVTVRASGLAVDLLQIYEQHNIDDVIVVDDDDRLAGMVDIQDLPKMKIL